MTNTYSYQSTEKTSFEIKQNTMPLKLLELFVNDATVYKKNFRTFSKGQYYEVK